MFEQTKRIEMMATEIPLWIREEMKKFKASRIVLGMSGGKDSTVSAMLAIKAIGAKNVIGVAMPNCVQNDIQDTIDICDILGIKMLHVNIGESFRHIAMQIPNFDVAHQAKINLAPRLRMATLMAVAQAQRAPSVVCNTCNFSEEFVGYGTYMGDVGCGAFAPIGKLTKEEVVAVGEKLAPEFNLPEHYITKTPQDGLSMASDEDILGVTYLEISEYIDKGSISNKAHEKMIRDMHEANKFKTENIRIDTYNPPV